MKKEAHEFLGCGEVPASPDWRLAAHLHFFHELILVKSGAMLLQTTHDSIRAVRGDILFYRAGLLHQEASDRASPVNTLFVAFRSREDLSDFPLRLRDTEGRVGELLSWLIRDRVHQRPVRDCLPLLNTVVQELRWLLSRPTDLWLMRVREYLTTHMARPLSIPEIAGYAGLSRFAFIRKFKRLTGRTPMEELRQIRLHAARNLILSQAWPMKVIAPAVGIGDECQLSKLFRRHFGVSPREMRRGPGKV